MVNRMKSRSNTGEEEEEEEEGREGVSKSSRRSALKLLEREKTRTANGGEGGDEVVEGGRKRSFEKRAGKWRSRLSSVAIRPAGR